MAIYFFVIVGLAGTMTVIGVRHNPLLNPTFTLIVRGFNLSEKTLPQMQCLLLSLLGHYYDPFFQVPGFAVTYLGASLRSRKSVELKKSGPLCF